MVTWFWGHVGWLFVENRQLSSPETYEKYAKDMLRDPFYLKLERNLMYLWVYVIHAVLFYVVGFGVGYLMHGTLTESVRVGTQWVLWGRGLSYGLYVERYLGRQFVCPSVRISELRNAG